ncbi:MAG: hypothetical protein FWG87_14395 [Defluviitaleaceae bacterium]|nr:hypothetical protein [Defluviitaleaceae bacterium]
MVTSTVASISEDRLARQAYLRRQDDIVIANIKARELEQAERELEQLEAAIAEKAAENEWLRQQLAMLTQSQGN